MASELIADSDVLVDYLKAIEPGRSAVEAAIRAGELVTTAISSFELWTGARTSAERATVGRLLSKLTVFPLGSLASERAANLAQELSRRGQAVGTADVLIAGIALSRNARLLTRNRRHFERVPGLVVESP